MQTNLFRMVSKEFSRERAGEEQTRNEEAESWKSANKEKEQKKEILFQKMLFLRCSLNFAC